MPGKGTTRKQRIDWTKIAQNELAQRIAEAVDASSFRIVETESGVARGSLENIVYGRLKTHPELKTIDLLANYFKVPNWRVQAWVGIDADLPGSGDPKANIARISQLVSLRPELAPLLEHLADLTPDEIRAARAFLESLEAQRKHRQPPPSPPEEAS